MNTGENTACSFVVRIWVDTDDEPMAQLWRGRVTAIPSGDQKYFDDLSELNDFIAAYLQRIGVSVECPRRL